MRPSRNGNRYTNNAKKSRNPVLPCSHTPHTQFPSDSTYSNVFHPQVDGVRFEDGKHWYRRLGNKRNNLICVSEWTWWNCLVMNYKEIMIVRFFLPRDTETRRCQMMENRNFSRGSVDFNFMHADFINALWTIVAIQYINATSLLNFILGLN